MRVSQAEKQKSHERIVASAARIMRERGVDGASVADVMREAGLTHGGFYRHFDNKDALLASALRSAFDQTLAELERRLDADDPETAVAEFRDFYLSQGHVDQPGIGCPVAAVGADLGRGPAHLKAVFGRGVNRMIAAFARGMTGSAQDRRAEAIRELAMLVGAIVTARACDPETGGEVRAACQR